jgi:hypothetical protein
MLCYAMLCYAMLCYAMLWMLVEGWGECAVCGFIFSHGKEFFSLLHILFLTVQFFFFSVLCFAWKTPSHTIAIKTVEYLIEHANYANACAILAFCRSQWTQLDSTCEHLASSS